LFCLAPPPLFRPCFQEIGWRLQTDSRFLLDEDLTFIIISCQDIEVPDIVADVFEKMLIFIYTAKVDLFSIDVERIIAVYCAGKVNLGME
jgi:hypothetical protein